MSTKIKTTYICPPIPYRNLDWCAHYDGFEEDGEYGWGETEAEAVEDLKAEYPKDPETGEDLS